MPLDSLKTCLPGYGRIFMVLQILDARCLSRTPIRRSHLIQNVLVVAMMTHLLVVKALESIANRLCGVWGKFALGCVMLRNALVRASCAVISISPRLRPGIFENSRAKRRARGKWDFDVQLHDTFHAIGC